MALSEAERERRWSVAHELMSTRGLDAIVAFGDAGDVPAYQRYLSGYRSMHGDVVAVLFADGRGDLIVASRVVADYARHLSWIGEPRVVGEGARVLAGGPSEAAGRIAGMGQEVARIMADHGAKRLGIAGLGRMPSQWRDDLLSTIPGLTLTDVAPDLKRHRLVKSPFEVELIEESCRIASEAWSELDSILAAGRREFEVLADIEHLLRLRGCEDSFNLIISVPRVKTAIDRLPSSRMLKRGDHLSIEISPRYQGYYGQLTALATIGCEAEQEVRAAYDAGIQARAAGLRVMKPGADLIDVRRAVETDLHAAGYELATPMIGHFCGLELDDLRAGDASLVLETGMTFVFHPLLSGFPGLIRGDTYLITDSGNTPLTEAPLEPIRA